MHLSRWSGLVFLLVVLVLGVALVLPVRGEPPQPPGALGPTLKLHAGWDMISTPVNSSSITSLHGDCSVSSGPWWWTGSHYELATVVEPAKGYWIKVGDDCTMEALTLGRDITQPLYLAPGWNLISSSTSWNDTNTGGCKLLSGPWWWDGQKYQQIAADKALDGFKGYWIMVADNCLITSVKSPLVSATGLHNNLDRTPLALQAIRLVIQGAAAELSVHGLGISSSEVRLFSLAGALVVDARGSGDTLRFLLRTAEGPLANGVYLYQVTVRGPDGQTTSSEVRKVLILR